MKKPMRLSEVNAKLRAIQRVRRYKWMAAAMLCISALGGLYVAAVEDRIAAWLAAALAPLGVTAGLQWWRDTPMPVWEFVGFVAAGALAAWGAVRSGHPNEAWRLLGAAAGAGALLLYSHRGR